MLLVTNRTNVVLHLSRLSSPFSIDDNQIPIILKLSILSNLPYFFHLFPPFMVCRHAKIVPFVRFLHDADHTQHDTSDLEGDMIRSTATAFDQT